MPSEAATAACVVAELVWVAADPDRACEARRRGVRRRLRAGLFASPVSAFAGLVACLRVCLLAIVFVLCIRTAPVAMLTPPQARRSGPGGAATRRRPSTWTAMLPLPGKSSAMSPDNDFSLRGKLHQTPPLVVSASLRASSPEPRRQAVSPPVRE